MVEVVYHRNGRSCIT